MIEYFSKHPTAANLMMAAFLVMGLLTVNQLKREAMPEFSPKTLQITGAYSGATAEEIEEAIAVPIEETQGKARPLNAELKQLVATLST